MITVKRAITTEVVKRVNRRMISGKAASISSLNISERIKRDIESRYYSDNEINANYTSSRMLLRK